MSTNSLLRASPIIWLSVGRPAGHLRLLNLQLCGVVFLPDLEREELPARRDAPLRPKKESEQDRRHQGRGGASSRGSMRTSFADRNGRPRRPREGRRPRIEPGGTIGSSEEIHRELTRLTSGVHPRHSDWKAKKFESRMGSIAASGGYYIAMPAEKVFAEKGCPPPVRSRLCRCPTSPILRTRTASASNSSRAGGIKGAARRCTMSPEERQPWQDMVDQSYEQFLDVVAKGRPKLTKEQLRSEGVMNKQAKIYDDKGNVKLDNGKPVTIEVTRFRADGGSFTAAEAKQLGLIDDIGSLEDAVTAVAASAGVSEYRVVTYKRPPTLLGALFGVKSQPEPLELKNLSNGLSPKLWYMAPGSELSGIVAASSGK